MAVRQDQQIRVFSSRWRGCLGPGDCYEARSCDVKTGSNRLADDFARGHCRIPAPRGTLPGCRCDAAVSGVSAGSGFDSIMVISRLTRLIMPESLTFFWNGGPPAVVDGDVLGLGLAEGDGFTRCPLSVSYSAGSKKTLPSSR